MQNCTLYTRVDCRRQMNILLNHVKNAKNRSSSRIGSKIVCCLFIAKNRSRLSVHNAQNCTLLTWFKAYVFFFLLLPFRIKMVPTRNISFFLDDVQMDRKTSYSDAGFLICVQCQLYQFWFHSINLVRVGLILFVLVLKYGHCGKIVLMRQRDKGTPKSEWPCVCTTKKQTHNAK